MPCVHHEIVTGRTSYISFPSNQTIYTSVLAICTVYILLYVPEILENTSCIWWNGIEYTRARATMILVALQDSGLFSYTQDRSVLHMWLKVAFAYLLVVHVHLEYSFSTFQDYTGCMKGISKQPGWTAAAPKECCLVPRNCGRHFTMHCSFIYLLLAWWSLKDEQE